MTIWRMRIACWIPKAKNTHSDYVILIAFPLRRQCLSWYVSFLRNLPYRVACFCCYCCLFVCSLFKLPVATVRALCCSVHLARYELVACTTTPALHPAGRLTMLAVASHFIRPCRGPHINSWSLREFSSIYSLSASPFVPSLFADAPRSHPALALLVTCWLLLLQ